MIERPTKENLEFALLEARQMRDVHTIAEAVWCSLAGLPIWAQCAIPGTVAQPLPHRSHRRRPGKAAEDTVNFDRLEY